MNSHSLQEMSDKSHSNSNSIISPSLRSLSLPIAASSTSLSNSYSMKSSTSSNSCSISCSPPVSTSQSPTLSLSLSSKSKSSSKSPVISSSSSCTSAGIAAESSSLNLSLKYDSSNPSFACSVASLGHPDLSGRLGGAQAKEDASRTAVESIDTEKENTIKNETIRIENTCLQNTVFTKQCNLPDPPESSRVMTSQMHNYNKSPSQNTITESPKSPGILTNVLTKNRVKNSPQDTQDYNFERIRAKFEEKDKNVSVKIEKSINSPTLMKLMQSNERKLSEKLKPKRDKNSIKKLKKTEKDAKLAIENKERMKIRDIQVMFDSMANGYKNVSDIKTDNMVKGGEKCEGGMKPPLEVKLTHSNPEKNVFLTKKDLCEISSPVNVKKLAKKYS